MPPKRATKGARGRSGARAAAPAPTPIPAPTSPPPPPAALAPAHAPDAPARRGKREVPYDGDPATSPLYRLTRKSGLLLPLLLAWYALLAGITHYLHYKLPTPVSVEKSAAVAAAGQPAPFSEENARAVMTHLSQDIGYRIVGTKEHVDAEEWLWERVSAKAGWYPNAPAAGRNSTRGERFAGVHVEAWRQIDDGSHRFDFMSAIVQKKYYGMSNVIVRLSDGTDEGKVRSPPLTALSPK